MVPPFWCSESGPLLFQVCTDSTLRGLYAAFPHTQGRAQARTCCTLRESLTSTKKGRVALCSPRPLSRDRCIFLGFLNVSQMGDPK